MTPTQRSLKYLRDLGYLCEVVEHWNYHTNRRKDLLGFGDILAIRDHPILVQVTSGSNLAARVEKIKTECRDNALAWLRAGGEIEVHGWRELAAYRKDGKRAVRGKWEVKLESLGQEDLE